MIYCNLCLTPSSRPRIVFNNGTCNACTHGIKKDNNDLLAERNVDFQKIVKNIKKQNTRNEYDCIVPWSGGKDSSAVALRLKNDFGLHPLLVTFNPLIPTLTGIHNRKSLLDFGFDSIYCDTDNKVSSYLSKRFLIERGNPKLHWDAAVSASIFRMAIKMKIPFIFYAEHGESTYGGRVLNQNSEKIRDYEEVIENQVGDFAENWYIKGEISQKNLIPYIMPEEEDLKKNNIVAYYFGYFNKWNIVGNFEYVNSMIDFKIHPEKRTCGTVTNFDSLDDYMDDIYYYFQYIKFGFGRAIRDLSRQIQMGEIKRNEAIELAKKYDGEFPEKSLPHVLEYLNMSKEDFTEIVDKHRPTTIWEKKNGIWKHLHSYKLFEKI